MGLPWILAIDLVPDFLVPAVTVCVLAANGAFVGLLFWLIIGKRASSTEVPN